MKFTRRCAGGIKIKQKLNAHFVILSGPCLWQSSSRRSNPHEKDLDQDVDHHRPNWKQSELSSLMCTVVTQCDTWSTCSEYCWQVLETISKVVINRSCWQCKPSHPLSKRLVFRIYIYIIYIYQYIIARKLWRKAFNTTFFGHVYKHLYRTASVNQRKDHLLSKIEHQSCTLPGLLELLLLVLSGARAHFKHKTLEP